MHAALTVVTRDYDAAQDCLQDALVQAMTQWGRVATMDNPEGWIYTVAINAHRRSSRRQAILNRILQRQGRERTTSPRVAAVEVWPVVEELPERQRTAVALRHLAHLKEPEIAEIMQISRGTVSSTLRAAYSRLENRLSEDEVPTAKEQQ